MDQEKVITIKPEKADFEEIYFGGNQGSLLFSPVTKSKTIITVISAVVLLAFFLLKDHLSRDSFGILYFLSFILLLCAIFLSVSVNKVSRWKKQVTGYLKLLENCRLYEIRFDNAFFRVTIDKQTETSEWKDFRDFDVNDRFISLEGKYSYMFPKKSMSEKDYGLLTKVIKENVKQE